MSDGVVRDRLPIPDRPYAGPVYEDASDPAATFPPIEPLRPPAGAPNVLIILLDDVGFGAARPVHDCAVAGAAPVRRDLEATVPMIFSADETCDVGSDTGSAVTPDYTPDTSRFTGKIEWVQIDIDAAAENLDHLISPEERLRIAMARQ